MEIIVTILHLPLSSLFDKYVWFWKLIDVFRTILFRHALTIGSKAVPIVKLIMLVSYPIAKPMAMALDKLLGRELGTIYSKYEMKKLIEIHMERGGFDKDTGTAMTGALKYHDITVEEIMTPIAHVFMLPVDEKLSFKTIATIFRSGFSRIPVYEVSKDNVIGLLFVKDLIFVDPDDETPVRNFVQIFGRGKYLSLFASIYSMPKLARDVLHTA